MLQQTQVNRVLIFYSAWIKKFPSWKYLAKASKADIIRAWGGLGYNRRALVLQDVAQHVVKHGVPNSEEEWRAIKGIGLYTAAAVSAFAQRRRTLPIDTNVRRVLGRVLLGKPFPSLVDDDNLRAKAHDFLPHHGAYFDVPQAIFDLATLICTKNPACNTCPLRQSCKAAKLFLSGRVKIPKRSAAVAQERRYRNKPHPDRIYRGRILKLVRERDEVTLSELGFSIDEKFDVKRDQKWIDDMVARLARDGLLVKKRNKCLLPFR